MPKQLQFHLEKIGSPINRRLGLLDRPDTARADSLNFGGFLQQEPDLRQLYQPNQNNIP